MAKQLRAVGWEPEEARGVWSIDEPYNMILDVTKGAQYMQEVRDMVLAGYRWGLKEGPIAYEQIRGLKVKITDVALHEDPVHRGPAQIMPMTRRAMFTHRTPAPGSHHSTATGLAAAIVPRRVRRLLARRSPRHSS